MTEPMYVFTGPRRALTIADATAYAERPALPYVQLPTWAFRLPDPAFRTFAALASFADLRTGVCWPSHTALAERAGIGEKSVRRGLSTLRERGAVSWTRRLNDRGQASNRYTVHLDPTAPPVTVNLTVTPPVRSTVTGRSD